MYFTGVVDQFNTEGVVGCGRTDTFFGYSGSGGVLAGPKPRASGSVAGCLKAGELLVTDMGLLGSINGLFELEFTCSMTKREKLLSLAIATESGPLMAGAISVSRTSSGLSGYLRMPDVSPVLKIDDIDLTITTISGSLAGTKAPVFTLSDLATTTTEVPHTTHIPKKSREKVIGCLMNSPQ